MKSDAAIKELAKEVFKNEVFVAHNKESLETAFSTILMFAEFPTDTVTLYANYADTFSRSLNGYPLFHTCGWLNEMEYNKLNEYVSRLKEAEDAL